MTLKLNPNPTFKSVVEIPAHDGKPSTLTFEFRHRTKAALDAFIASEEWRKASDVENVMALAVGWEGVEGDYPFNAENLELLFQNYQAAPRIIVSAYLEALTQARLGN